MSVTFRVDGAGARMERVPCTYGEGTSWACSPAERCGYCDDGVEEQRVPLAPEADMANVSAAAILRLLGVESAPCGDWPLARIPTLRRAIVRALSTSAAITAEVVPASAHGGPGTGRARVIDGGMDQERITRNLRALDAVLAAAQAAQTSVTWD